MEEGRIMGLVGVKRRGINVFIPKFGIEGPVFRIHGADGDEDFVPETGGIGVMSKDGKKTFRIFDTVTVRIEVHFRCWSSWRYL